MLKWHLVRRSAKPPLVLSPTPCSSPNPPGTCQPVGEGAHTSTEQQSKSSGMIQRHHLGGYLLHHFGGLLAWLPSQGAAAGRMRAGIAMTKPRAWRGCLNQMLIPYLLEGPAAARCQRGSPLLLAPGTGEEGGLGTASPPAAPMAGRGPGSRAPPKRQAGSVTSAARIEMVGRAGQMAEGGEMAERAEY